MPNPIQYLRRGKALCGAVFANFADTFNWHNDFCRNLKGDADVPGSVGGHVTIDRADPSAPVIRLRDLPAGGGGGTGVAGEDQQVVTDVSLELDASSSVPRLVLKKTVKTCKVVSAASGAGTTSVAAAINLATVAAVVGSEYASPNFVNTVKTLTVLSADAEGEERTVFTATPHSEEG